MDRSPQVSADGPRSLELPVGQESPPEFIRPVSGRRAPSWMRHLSWAAVLRALVEDGPSWLVSLFTHVSLFVLLTSFVQPKGSGSRSGGDGQIALTIGFSSRQVETPLATASMRSTDGNGEASEESEASAGETGSLAPNESTSASSATSPQSEASQPFPEEAPQVARRDPASPRRPAARRVDKPRPGIFESEYQRWVEQSVREYKGDGKPSRYAALLNRIRPTKSVNVVARAVQPLTEVVDPRQKQLDKIVDDFIAYDIGQIRGSAGQRAFNRFMALGKDSIPALVRGLNKSASIHASCPVGVIAGKLMNTLRLANDPAMRQYALDNIGVGVPENAPHYQRLLAMRKSWLQGPALPPQVVKVLEDLQAGQDGELMELMLAISDAPCDTAIAALESGDNYLASAAAMAALQGRANWPNDQRARIGHALHRLASTTLDPDLKSLAREAHRAVAATPN